ncbi:hypothetical protein VTO42DRAFT_983 [Malbranchea cinnamomea]
MHQLILVTHSPAYREIFHHIRDQPDQPILFHCAGGKDCTGVMAAVILQLAGYPAHVVARDYTLTGIGVEPVSDFLGQGLDYEKLKASPIAQRGLAGLCSVHYETMVRFLAYLQDKYEDGAKGYIMTELGFSKEDVEKNKSNLKG